MVASKSKQITFNARFSYALYHNEENDYCIYKYVMTEKPKEIRSKKVMCVGTALPTNKKIRYSFICKETCHPRYGTQYEVLSYEENIGEEESDIVSYLSSGIFPGIREKVAKKIYKKFGSNTLSVIENTPELLETVQGISKKKADAIGARYQSNRDELRLMKRLSKYDITVGQAHEIALRFKKQNINEIIEKDPYRISLIRGINFNTCDMIAKDHGMTDTDFVRISAAAVEAIHLGNASGNVAMPVADFAKEFVRICNCREITMSNWWQYIYGPLNYDPETRKIQLLGDFTEGHVPKSEAGPIRTHTIYREKGISRSGDNVELFYTKKAYEAEVELANAVSQLCSGKKEKFDISTIEGVEDLDPSQKKAVETALSNPMTIVRGGPGTGKTTILKKIVTAYKKKYPRREIVLLAPTGRAARRMTESIGLTAHTIHSYMQIGVSENESQPDTGSSIKIKNALLIVDETSMLDLYIATTLLSNTTKSKIILVGDTDQLPSVGIGSVLEDLIESGCIPVATLLYTHRQADGSTICENAALIRQGDASIKAASDFTIKKIPSSDGFMDDRQLSQMEKEMVEEYLQGVMTYGRENTICLCPYKKYPGGTYSMNNRIQEILNPAKEGAKEFSGINEVFRIGDPAIQLINVRINDDDEGSGEEVLSNGDIGTVTAISEENDEPVMTVDFENGIRKKYRRTDINTLALAYAITVHKSQGSEYSAVITGMCDSHRIMLYRKLIYTAITRGAKKVSLITSDTALQKAVANVNAKKRHTFLAERIRFLADSCTSKKLS